MHTDNNNKAAYMHTYIHILITLSHAWQCLRGKKSEKPIIFSFLLNIKHVMTVHH